MNPCIDQILVGVANPAQIAAISHWSHDPAATSLPAATARRFPAHFGTAEEVIRARPDLVMLSPHTPLATKAALARLGIAMLEVGVPQTVAQSHAQVRDVARAAGWPGRGEAMVAGIDRALAASAHPGPPAPALIRMASGMVPGEGTLAADLMARTGFLNQSAAYGLAMWDIAAVEPLVRRPPALILTDRPDALHPVLRRAGVRAEPFPGALLNCGGPTIARAARHLAGVRARIGS